MQQRVTLTLETHKLGHPFEHEVLPIFRTNPMDKSSSGFRVLISDAAIPCKNNVMTEYFGIAYSKALIGGKWLFAGKTRSPKIVPLPCGT
jgi:hypothetical protein